MARSTKTTTRKPHAPLILVTPGELRDLVGREGWPAGFDPSYGESLGQLMPPRLRDLVLRP